ncbi:MAG TPA: nickel-dependent lactate racemase [Chloroflexota bacterium]|nr:nickel-dependent lactate racemase [Chloroflexota bacterium]
MKVQLAYGKDGLSVELPERNVTVVEPRYVPGVADERGALREAMRHPIGAPPLVEVLRPEDTVAIVFCDVTRPMPNDRVLPVLLEEIERVVPRERITLVNGTGTHRANTEAELRGMLGDAVFERYRIVTNDARDPASLVRVGTTTSGNEVWLNRDFVAASAKILTGFIEPHFFAGFSGGPKMVMPAVAGLETVMRNHGARNIGHPQATWGVTHGNPIWEEIREAALMVAPRFSLNVTLNKAHEITAVFAGDVLASHGAGCAWAKGTAMRQVEHPFDVVLTTNSGYPLDLNVYQTIKGVSAAARIVKPGGAVVAAAECWDGIPDHGQYRELLASGHDPEAILRRIEAPGFRMPDQWQAQIQALIQRRCRVYLYSSLPDEVVRQTHLTPCRDIETTVARLLEEYGPQATLCVLPQGPQTIPNLAGARQVGGPAQG